MSKREFETVHDVLNYIQTNLKAPKDKYNSFGKYNYRSKEGILDAVKPYLEETGSVLTIEEQIHEPWGNSNLQEIVIKATAILRYGGEEIEATSFAGVDVNKKGMDKAQTFGSSSSYAGKYALGNLFLIDDTKDSDATNTHGKDDSKNSSKGISEARMNALKNHLKDNPQDLNKVLISPKNVGLSKQQAEELTNFCKQ